MKKTAYDFGARLVILFLFSCLVCGNVAGQSVSTSQKSSANVVYHHPIFSYKIINSDSSTFGYDIYRDNKLLIHQNSIPALPGNKGFKTKENAEKTARLVIQKLRAGEMPPTVTIEEMEKMKVI